MEKFIKQLKADEAKKMLAEIVEYLEWSLKYDYEHPYEVDKRAEEEVSNALQKFEVPSVFYLAKWTASENLKYYQDGRIALTQDLQHVINQSKERIMEKRKIDKEIEENFDLEIERVMKEAKLTD
jgi:hypothetical protein